MRILFSQRQNMEQISNWVKESHQYLPHDGQILDLACGNGRHSQFLEEHGFDVTAVDLDVTNINQRNLTKTIVIQADLEGEAWPFSHEQFDGIIVVNYLWRKRFQNLSKTLKSGGILIYDTFCAGNEKYGRPKSPDFLLKAGELKVAFPDMDVVAFEEGYRATPSPAMKQSIVLRKR
ncbi:MAG: class I SAM-dependent methyltransferase [Sneathiella sp.]